MSIHTFPMSFLIIWLSFLYTDENFEIPFGDILIVIVQSYTNCKSFYIV